MTGLEKSFRISLPASSSRHVQKVFQMGNLNFLELMHLSCFSQDIFCMACFFVAIGGKPSALFHCHTSGKCGLSSKK